MVFFVNCCFEIKRTIKILSLVQRAIYVFIHLYVLRERILKKIKNTVGYFESYWSCLTIFFACSQRFRQRKTR